MALRGWSRRPDAYEVGAGHGSPTDLPLGSCRVVLWRPWSTRAPSRASWLRNGADNAERRPLGRMLACVECGPRLHSCAPSNPTPPPTVAPAVMLVPSPHDAAEVPRLGHADNHPSSKLRRTHGGCCRVHLGVQNRSLHDMEVWPRLCSHDARSPNWSRRFGSACLPRSRPALLVVSPFAGA
jgi:hypothetical protein